MLAVIGFYVMTIEILGADNYYKYVFKIHLAPSLSPLTRCCLLQWHHSPLAMPLGSVIQSVQICKDILQVKLPMADKVLKVIERS